MAEKWLELVVKWSFMSRSTFCNSYLKKSRNAIYKLKVALFDENMAVGKSISGNSVSIQTHATFRPLDSDFALFMKPNLRFGEFSVHKRMTQSTFYWS